VNRLPDRRQFALVIPWTLHAASSHVTKNSLVVDGQPRDYFLFVPEGLTSPAPLLVLFHGSGHDGWSLIEPWKKLAEQEGIVLVGPNARNSAEWSTPMDGPKFVIEVIEAVKKANPINPRRVYLFGHSAGAEFALMMSLLAPEYFAAASAHAGVFRESPPPSMFEDAKRKIPILLLVGTEERVYPVPLVRTMRDLFAKNGFPVEIEEIPGHDHNYYAAAARINRDVWNFLKEKQLAADPRSDAR